MRKMKRIGLGLTTVLFTLSIIAVCNSQIATAAKINTDVSKRSDFATSDKKFGTNEHAYIRVHLENQTVGDRIWAIFWNGKNKKSLTKALKRADKIKIMAPKTAVSFRDDIVPLFNQGGAWVNFDSADLSYTACTACHGSNVLPELDPCPPKCHLIDFNTHAGWMAGADGGTEPLLGEAVPGVPPFDWGHSGLRRRLRNNRMPPAFPFMLDESNRPGPDLGTVNDGNDLALVDPLTSVASGFFVKVDAGGAYEYGGGGASALGAIGAWVDGTDAGLAEGNVVPYGGLADVTWADVAPFFTQPNTWFDNSLACICCHYCNVEPPCYHLLDFSHPAGFRIGADGGSEPILGETVSGVPPFDWGHSGLRGRLRNNRMPPNVPFDLNELSRLGPTLSHPVSGAPVRAVNLIGEWVGDGAPDN